MQLGGFLLHIVQGEACTSVGSCLWWGYGLKDMLRPFAVLLLHYSAIYCNSRVIVMMV